MTREVVFKSFLWKLAERLSSQGVSFIVSIVLARLLMPEQFGIIAMIHIFIAIGYVFIIGGLSSSLIQKKDADDMDFSTILFCTVAVSALLYAIIYLS